MIDPQLIEEAIVTGLVASGIVAQGPQGIQGIQGEDGRSAYQVAVDEGFLVPLGWLAKPPRSLVRPERPGWMARTVPAVPRARPASTARTRRFPARRETRENRAKSSMPAVVADRAFASMRTAKTRATSRVSTSPAM
jgi:hypothetical protein